MSMQAINYALTLPVKDPGPRLTLIVISHHINYRTGFMYVGQDELAEEVGCSERSLRRYLKALEEAGFLKREERRAPDGKRTTDCIELIGYLEWQHVVEHGGTLPDPRTRGTPVHHAEDQAAKFAASDESNRPKVADQADKKAPTSGQQVSGIKDNHFNQYNHSARDAREGKNLNDVLKSEEPPPAKAKPAFTLTPADGPQWRAWLAHLSPDDAERADASGKIVVTARWPDKPGAELLSIPATGLTERSKRMAGETA